MRAVFLSLSMFCLNLVFGQNIEEIKLNVNIQDPMKSTKSLSLLDLRENKEVGQIKKNSSGKESKVVFQKEEKQAVKEWFEKYNETKGKDELYLVLKLRRRFWITGSFIPKNYWNTFLHSRF